MIIQLTDEMKAKAEEAELTISKNLKTPTNYTGLESDRRYYYGALGELAFVESLKLRGKRAEYHPKFDGNSDKGDVTLFLLLGTSVQVDVKTASQPFHKYIMLPQRQLKAHKRSAYIGVRLNKDTAEILGFCYPSDLKQASGYGLDLKIPTYCLPFDELKDIEWVYKNIEDGSLNDISTVL